MQLRRLSGNLRIHFPLLFDFAILPESDIIWFVLKRESPSGKALAFQANIREFESRLPLFLFKNTAVSGQITESVTVL